jgi:hypothetical protein
MDAHRFADRYPRSFHMADENSWPQYDAMVSSAPLRSWPSSTRPGRLDTQF